MCKLVLDRGSIAEFTSVSNIFMDEYMPRANGDLLRFIFICCALLTAITTLLMSLQLKESRTSLIC